MSGIVRFADRVCNAAFANWRRRLATAVAWSALLVAGLAFTPLWRWALIGAVIVSWLFLLRHDWLEDFGNGIHKRADAGVGGGAGGLTTAVARETAGGTSVTPSATGGYARVAITNATAGADTSITFGPFTAGSFARGAGYGYSPVAKLAGGLLPPGRPLTPWPSLGSFSFSRSDPVPVAPPRPLREMGTLTDYVIGWRSWHPLGTELRPTGYALADAWVPGANHALCLSGHASPDRRCACGFYVRRSLLEMWGTYNTGPGQTIYGAVRCWGRIIEHGREGFRVEHAEIVGLLFDIGIGAESDVLRVMAKAYAVPVLHQIDLERYAYEFGSRLPEPE